MSTTSEIEKTNNSILYKYCNNVLISIEKKEIGIRNDMKVPDIIPIVKKVIPVDKQDCIDEIISLINLDIIKEFLKRIMSYEYKIEDVSTKQMLFLCMNNLEAKKFTHSIMFNVFPALSEATEINEIVLNEILNTCSKC